MGLNLPRSGLVQHPDAEDGRDVVFFVPVRTFPLLIRRVRWAR
jgi:hypothetical protein